jgi:hypothetical protein
MAAIFAARNAPENASWHRWRADRGEFSSPAADDNVTHDVVEPDDFNGNRNAIAKSCGRFPSSRRSPSLDLGVQLKREETGKLFP